MDVYALPAVHDGLARYRITVSERPGRYTILEVPADVEDPEGLVELFAASHLHVLEWASVADEDHEVDEWVEPPSDYRADTPPHQRHAFTTG
jgi:hypothetical protein